MKKMYFAFIMTFMIIGVTNAQNINAQEIAIKKDFNTYLKAIVNKEFSKSMDFLLPEFFDYFPRETMESAMEQAFSNPDMVIELSDPKILSVANAKEIDGKFYSKLRYSNMMNLKVLGDEAETKEEEAMMIGIMTMSFAQTFGEENVNYNEETEFYNIHSEKDVIAISIDGFTDWKFLVLEEQQMAILEKLVPAEVIATFKK